MQDWRYVSEISSKRHILSPQFHRNTRYSLNIVCKYSSGCQRLQDRRWRDAGLEICDIEQNARSLSTVFSALCFVFDVVDIEILVDVEIVVDEEIVVDV